MDNPRRINEHLIIFEDTGDPTVPTILYYANPVDVPTYVLEYSKELFDSVCDSMRNLIVDSKEVIVDIVRKKAGVF